MPFLVTSGFFTRERMERLAPETGPRFAKTACSNNALRPPATQRPQPAPINRKHKQSGDTAVTLGAGRFGATLESDQQELVSTIRPVQRQAGLGPSSS